jgi:DNA-binding transcriptional ArsR family regulator
MQADAPIAPLASLIADPTRATLLWALADGRALPACDLALQARVGAPTISFHLGKLIAGGLVEAEKSGRHRYYRLADPSIVALLEKLAVFAPPSRPARSFAEGQNGKKLRFARSCYDHLAGRAGVAVAEALVAAGHLSPSGGDYQLSAAGEIFFAEIGIDLAAARATRRVFARRCLDWSERRHHLAGALGAALLELLFQRAFVQRAETGRALLLTAAGRSFLDERLGLRLT